MKQNFRGNRGLFILLLLLTIVLNICSLSSVDFQWLQQQELAFFDYAQVRANYTPKEERIVIVGITEEDIRQLQVDTLEDKTLATLLQRIKEQKPIAIGLDVVRDLPVGEGIEQLEEIFRSTPNLYGVGKFTGVKDDPFFHKIDSPPILREKGRVGDVSIMVDNDGVVRRGNLFPTTGENGVPSLGLIVAHRYLVENGYEEKTSPSKDLQIGEVVFPTFEASDGGYLNADAGGYQILMNWYHPPQSLPQVSVTDVLSGNIADDLFKDKIVLIGYYTISVKQDILSTPLRHINNQKTPRSSFGVEIHANLVSYLIGTVMDGQPLLKSVSNAIESVILTVWIVLTGTLVWCLKRIKSPLALFASGLGLAAFIAWLNLELNYQIFLQGWWLPIFPSTAIVITAIATLFYIFRERNLEHIENLELKIKERTNELELALRDLEQQKEQLIEHQEQLVEQQNQLIEQEKLAFLGRLTAGFCHQFKNPLALLKHGFATVVKNIKDSEQSSSTKYKSAPIELLLALQEPIDKLELLFKLILISPSQKKIVWLDTTPNEFVKTVTSSAVRFREKSFSNVIEFNLDSKLDRNFQVPQQLEIPVFNLIENAMDAVLEREKTDSSFKPLIRVQTKMLEGKWQILVRDNGIGISADIEKRIFEPFVTTKSDYKGIGLGLYISQEVMSSLIRGKLLLEVGEETKFKIIIPFFEKNG